MRKADAAAQAANKHSAFSTGRDQACVQLVCLALTLAVVALACRIYSVW